MTDDHRHAHGHSHASGTTRTRLTLVLVLSASYCVAEIVGGIVTNSLALFADAGHMFSDVGSLALALMAMRVAMRPPTVQRTFGYHRAEILAALANGATLVATALWIVVEAWQRFRNPPLVAGWPMMCVAAGGLAVNLVSLKLLAHGHDNLNMRGAWLHVASDALGSIGAIVAGLLIWRFQWAWADPAVSLLIAALVAISSWRMLRETVDVLMEAAPSHVNVAQIRRELAAVDGVASVHDLHVWSISSGVTALSGHVQLVDGVALQEREEMLPRLCRLLRERFNLRHVTLQVEPLGFDETMRCDPPVVTT